MMLKEYLSVPYLLVMDAIKHPEMDWIRRAAYPELPDCIVEAFSPWEAIEELEKLKTRIIVTKLSKGESVPMPREPLKSIDHVLELKRLGFTELIGLLECEERDLVMHG